MKMTLSVQNTDEESDENDTDKECDNIAFRFDHHPYSEVLNVNTGVLEPGNSMHTEKTGKLKKGLQLSRSISMVGYRKK